jgi:hypothetical protein
LAGRAGTDRRTRCQDGLAVNQKPVTLGLSGVPSFSGNLVLRAIFVRIVQLRSQSLVLLPNISDFCAICGITKSEDRIS